MSDPSSDGGEPNVRKNSKESINLYPTRRKSGFRTALVLIASLAMTPLILDGTKICVARWQSMSGPVPTIRTPTLDLVQEVAGNYRREAKATTTRFFNRVPWRADLVVAGLGLCAVLACLFLRHR